MVEIKHFNMITFLIMAAITVLNTGLLLNFVTASGQALAVAFNSESIFLFAAVEFVIVLLAYVLHKLKTSPTHTKPKNTATPA